MEALVFNSSWTNVNLDMVHCTNGLLARLSWDVKTRINYHIPCQICRLENIIALQHIGHVFSSMLTGRAMRLALCLTFWPDL
jgi:hypothetical protein